MCRRIGSLSYARFEQVGLTPFRAAASDDASMVGGPGAALAFGAGLRFVPTWLSNIVPRLDVSRLIAPEPSWFVQVGIHQYF